MYDSNLMVYYDSKRIVLNERKVRWAGVGYSISIPAPLLPRKGPVRIRIYDNDKLILDVNGSIVWNKINGYVYAHARFTTNKKLDLNKTYRIEIILSGDQ